MPATGFELAKRIQKSCGDNPVEARTFLRREACVSDIFLWTRQVDFTMGHIHVPAKDHWFLRLQPL